MARSLCAPRHRTLADVLRFACGREQGLGKERSRSCRLQYYAEITRNMVGRVLTNRQVVRRYDHFAPGGRSLLCNCPLQFFTADPYDVEAASLCRPASTAIKFDPVTRQTTSSKRGYPNPMAPFLHGYRCPRRWRCTPDQNSVVSAHPTRWLYY